jgi:phosphoglycerate dehydrogenase-like enzyme/predicted dehydrogenase
MDTHDYEWPDQQNCILPTMSIQAMKTRHFGVPRALVIGAGPMSDAVHLPRLTRLRDRGEIVLRIICDLQRTLTDKMQPKFGFEEHTSDALAAICRQDIDVVYIFADAPTHFSLGIEALRHGKHVFVEKPIAPSFGQAIEMAELARARGLIAVGGHNRRYYASLAAVRERAGLARWRFVEAAFHKPAFGKAPPFGARTWLTGNGIHALDALVDSMTGLPVELAAFTDGSATPSAFSAQMRWADGAQATFLCNNDAASRREEYVFHGFGETLSIGAKGLTIEKDGTSQMLAMPTQDDGFTAEHEAFLAAIRDGVAPRHALDALAPSLFLAELIEQGYRGPVELPHTSVSRRGNPGRLSQDAALLIDDSGDLHGVPARRLAGRRLVSRAELLGASQSAHHVAAAILGRNAAPLTPDELSQMPNLAIVGIVALSVARHAPQALMARNITIVNASHAYAESVAEFALALATLARRRAFYSHELMRRGGWGVASGRRTLRAALLRGGQVVRPALKRMGLEPALLAAWRKTQRTSPAGPALAGRSRDLRGATIGLIGWGANARAFTRRLLSVGARVIVASEHASPEEVLQTGARQVSLREALAAEVVSLHRGLTSETRHGLRAAELSLLRPGAVLINVARGALIEPSALVDRLRQGDVFACLDTFDEEPLPASHPLRSMPNVFLTSHIAGGSPDMHFAAVEEVVAKIEKFFAHEAVEDISAARLATMT